jgi:hypothetical protein
MYRLLTPYVHVATLWCVWSSQLRDVLRRMVRLPLEPTTNILLYNAIAYTDIELRMKRFTGCGRY